MGQQHRSNAVRNATHLLAGSTLIRGSKPWETVSVRMRKAASKRQPAAKKFPKPWLRHGRATLYSRTMRFAMHPWSVPGPAAATALALVVVAASVGHAFETPKSWGGLEPGPHAVGFRVLHTYDHGRGAPKDTTDVQQRDRSRPMQVSMWYPAQVDAGTTRMPYGIYLGLSLGRHDFSVGKDARREVALGIAERRIAKYKAAVEPREWVELETAAVRDAAQAPGSFPVVLYAPGFSQPAFDNSLVCELLASHGYVVLAAPSVGATSARMTEDLSGIEAQVRDLEFLVAVAHDFPACDTRRIGAFGWSWGDIAVVLQQMRNRYIDAIISYDGSLEWNVGLARQALHFDPQRLNVPYLYACQGGLKGKSFEFFDALNPADAAILHFHRLTHGEFGSYRALLHNGFPDQFDYDTRSYEALCLYTLRFFAAHLSDDAGSRSFLARSPAQNGFEAELVEGRCILDGTPNTR